MTEPFNYTTTYVLDKSHYSETFDQSVVIEPGFKPYRKSLALVLVGFILLYVPDIDAYLAWFVVGLGVIEALSERFKKSWWLARQMISKAAGHKVTLVINEQGIEVSSLHVNANMSWDSISKIEATDKGWLLYVGKSRSYLSNRCLDNDAQEYLSQQAQSLFAERKHTAIS
ncbi:YcxB family protein [Neptunicella marina]|uniref:YcxB family protein n=1 Tax=Neptunicella marina TaxID=2125989 RepID=A0A8J6M2J5_9ALTE|nr:YcxB family protein [Neptunicella marina]MBC3766373.1 YcxB family protein [Neptunicella marina]